MEVNKETTELPTEAAEATEEQTTEDPNKSKYGLKLLRFFPSKESYSGSSRTIVSSLSISLFRSLKSSFFIPPLALLLFFHLFFSPGICMEMRQSRDSRGNTRRAKSCS